MFRGTLGFMSRASDPVVKTTIRARVLWAIILTAVIALAVSGTIVAVLQQRHIHDTAAQQLSRTYQELAGMVNPDNPKYNRFDNPGDVLKEFMRRGQINRYEGEVGFHFHKEGGSTQYTPSTELIDPWREGSELRNALQPYLHTTDKASFPIIEADGRTYRVLVAPILFPEDDRAVLIRVIDMDAASTQLNRTLLLYAIVAALAVAFVVCIAWLVVERLLRPIEQLREAAESIDEHDLTARVPVRGKDDLSALTLTMNRMLDRVQHAVEAQRNLLDDVGHELRTPITVVRGHLELIDPEDPQDVRQTRDLALDELDRMGTLVGDLLLLAKAIDTNFVQPVRCNVGQLTDQVLEKARALGDRHWVLEQLTPVEADLDPGRITQAWLQLAANAVKYSNPGSVVGIGSALAGPNLRLWVRDKGIGISAEELPLIRQRFRRGAGVKHTSGSGLGLSIVESIAAAHEGSLEIESEEGVGSLFTLVVPRFLTPETLKE